MALQWQIRRDESGKWSENNPILAEGEFGLETESINTGSLKMKMGDGINKWNDLLYVFQSPNSIKVEKLLATGGETSITVSSGAILDDGISEIKVNGNVWNSRTGIMSFVQGNISIDFLTGVITFHIPLDQGDQIIIKYN